MAKQRTAGRNARKDAQLCTQVSEAIDLVLGSVPDEDLLDLFVERVDPAPDAGHLRVVLRAPREADIARVLDALEAHHGELRAEVTSAIHRRRTPSLSFVVATDGPY